MNPLTSPATILTVCTHNRTRSVMSMALLQAGFDDRLGPGRVRVGSLGFGPEGLPAIPAAVEAMERRGLDVSDHRSRRVTTDRVAVADLVLTSEKAHVVAIAADSPRLYPRSFTLPEFCDRLGDGSAVHGRSLRDWVNDVSDGRSAGDYLRSPVPEIQDPTGRSRAQFDAAVVHIESWCTRVVDAVSDAL